MNKSVVATTINNRYRDVLLNKKCLRHSMNRNESTAQNVQLEQSESIIRTALLSIYENIV